MYNGGKYLWPYGFTAMALSVALCGPARAASAPNEDIERHLIQADDHEQAGRHVEALAAYCAAFDAMPAEKQSGEVAQFAVLAAADAALADYEVRGEQESLVRARRVLAAFVDKAESSAGSASTAEAKEKLAEIEALISVGEPEVTKEPPSLGSEPSDDPREPDREKDVGPNADLRGLSGLGKAGVALLATGGVAIFTGGILVAMPRPELEIEPGGVPQVRATREFGYGFLGGGAALAITGGVMLAIDRKNAKARWAAARNVAVLPWFRGGGAGLGMSGRF